MKKTRYVAVTSHGGYHQPWIVCVGEWEESAASVRATAEEKLAAERKGKALDRFEVEMANLEVLSHLVVRRKYDNEWEEYWNRQEKGP